MRSNHLRLASNVAQLLISLVPNNSFRHNYRPSCPFPYPGIKEYDFSSEAVLIIDQIYNVLLQSIGRPTNSWNALQDNCDSSDSESIADNVCERLSCTLSDLLLIFECK